MLRLRVWAMACLLLLPAALGAHDIYSSWSEAKLLPDKLELTITLARSCAHDLLENARGRPPLTPQSFAEFAPELRAIAPRLVRITASDRPLSVRSAEVQISGDNDVTFTLVYPAPAAGPLNFVVDYLRHLADGHVATLVVTNARGDDLDWSPLTVDQPAFAAPIAKPSPSRRK